MSDIERGRTAAKRDAAERIDQVLTSGGRLVALWESQYDGYQAPAWVREVSELEARATRIRDYHPLVVPGLLQTEEYATMAVRAGNKSATAREVGALVRARMDRQEVLRGDLAPRYLAVVDETVFRRPTGSRRVMAAQIEHLLTMADNERIEVLVVPLETPMHPGMDGAFRLISVPEVGEILWQETRNTGGPVENPEHIEEHVNLFADLLGVALPAYASGELLERIKGEMK
ncbi:hypothetical protein HDA32_000423 [Spinactinospora alkalitolerans]|uniref:DUF5753 domain-containing protein n=1 Tax=Spinactinospora alkalitolerans TaxID=687207 RepID=A0A852TRJ0_9ACTN|nr:hypothetical protein [Spinactinospora alkalitolerans]